MIQSLYINKRHQSLYFRSPWTPCTIIQESF